MKCCPTHACEFQGFRVLGSAPKQWAAMAIFEDKSLTFQAIFGGLSHSICLITSVGEKLKNLEWFFFICTNLHCQLHLEPTQPNSLVGCKMQLYNIRQSSSVSSVRGMDYCLMDQAQTAIPSWRWANFSPTYIAVWEPLPEPMLIYRQ